MEIYCWGIRNLLLWDEKSMVRPSTLTVRLSTLTVGASTFSLWLWEIILKASGKTVNVSGETVTDSEIYSAFAYNYRSTGKVKTNIIKDKNILDGCSEIFLNEQIRTPKIFVIFSINFLPWKFNKSYFVSFYNHWIGFCDIFFLQNEF